MILLTLMRKKKETSIRNAIQDLGQKGRSFKALGKAVRNKMSFCGVAKSMVLYRVERKIKTLQGDPK